MNLGISHQVPSYAWNNSEKEGSQVARGILTHLMYQLESGVSCPLTMTYAAIPALRHSVKGSIPHEYIKLLTSPKYDGRHVPVSEKGGATVGMSMTEKQGGSDVRSNTTTATPLEASHTSNGSTYTLQGHKWFTSAPMSDAFLTLAQTGDAGLSCFLVPRFLQDGTKNTGFQIQRLKDKLGDKSNASSEIEYRNAHGYLIGDIGKGVRTIVDMVVHTRLDCTIGSSALMRLCAQQAAYHTANRSAFGKVLINQPLMRAVVSDLGIESEAAICTWVRLARAFDRHDKGDANEGAFLRLATAISKYWICKRAPQVAYESMECFGGNGYVEDSIMPRLFRQSPLNAIWEGSGNVICMDVLRAMKNEPHSVQAFIAELNKTKGLDVRYDNLLTDIHHELQDTNDIESRCRRIVDKLAVALQASVLLQKKDSKLEKAFVHTRLSHYGKEGGVLGGWNYGSLTSNQIDKSTQEYIIDRLMPL